VGKWESGKVGKWESGKVGKWESGKVGKYRENMKRRAIGVFFLLMILISKISRCINIEQLFLYYGS
jgi:hypothetical protein